MRLMHCRYTRVFAKCSKVAADWQLKFSTYLTDTVANVFHYATHPDGHSTIEISTCSRYEPGRQHFSLLVIQALYVCPGRAAGGRGYKITPITSLAGWRERLLNHAFVSLSLIQFAYLSHSCSI